jgi:hypothetical protein
MTVVRMPFIAVLALHLTWVQAAGVPPCASGQTGAHSCCMRHQTDAGGAVIGVCGCLAAPEAADGGEVFSVPVPPAGGPFHVALAGGFEAGVWPSAGEGSPVDPSSPARPGAGPPRLSGAGFRC